MFGDHITLDAALGDFDGDGDLDAFQVTYDQGCRVWLNNGSRTFTDSLQVLVPNQINRAVALGDVDGDGDFDAVIGGYAAAKRVLLNDGSGTFIDSGQALQTRPTHALALGDLDGDGDLDMIEGLNGPSRIWRNQ